MIRDKGKRLTIEEKVQILVSVGNIGKIKSKSGKNISDIEKLYITDSLKVMKDRLGSKIEVLSVAPVIADAIRHIHMELSISVLFDK